MMRFFADLLLLVAATLLPWWLVLPCAAVFFFIFEHYVEFLLLALFMDLIYGAPLAHFFGFQFILSLGSAVLFLALTFIKKRMRI